MFILMFGAPSSGPQSATEATVRDVVEAPKSKLQKEAEPNIAPVLEVKNENKTEVVKAQQSHSVYYPVAI